MRGPRWTVWLFTVFAVIVVCFVTTTAIGTWHMRSIDRRALEIAENASPSIEHLAEARSRVRHLQVLLFEHVVRGAPFDGAKVAATRSAIDHELHEYLALPLFPGERDGWREIFAAKSELDGAISRFDSRVEENDLEGERRVLRERVSPAALRLSDAITHAVELNASHSHDLALEIRGVRSTVTTALFALDLMCTLIAMLGAVALVRVVRAHGELIERNRVLEQERAAELEQFAGRVAHDILGPLSVVGFALDLARLPGTADRERLLGRGQAAIDRVKRLVGGLLEFARAGAKPPPDACADVAAAMVDLLLDLEAFADENGVTLVVEPPREGSVACSDGVLASLLANLVRNAIKYIGDGPEKRVAVHAIDRGSRMRIEVTDTGPGLPPGLEAKVFEPYARGPSAQPGIGLGLATVKRLAEAHGGRVDVRSTPGHGCTFAFELPKA